jgi:hypothetical protein
MEALTLPRYSENKIFNYLKEVTDVAALSPEQRRRYERDLTNYWDACALDDEYERRKKELEDWEQKNKAKEQKIEAGKQEIENGKKEIETNKAISIARGLIKLNLPLADISSVTGLSIEEINAISLN